MQGFAKDTRKWNKKLKKITRNGLHHQLQNNLEFELVTLIKNKRHEAAEDHPSVTHQHHRPRFGISACRCGCHCLSLWHVGGDGRQPALGMCRHPFFSAFKDFFLPDGHSLFETINNELTCFEGFLSMGSRNSHDNRHIANV